MKSQYFFLGKELYESILILAKVRVKLTVILLFPLNKIFNLFTNLIILKIIIIKY